jgi:hypothetical protein
MAMNCRLFALIVLVGSIGGLSCGGRRVGSGISPDASTMCTGGEPPATGVLATGQHVPSGLAVDCANVYWINMGTPPPPTGGKPVSPYTDGQVMKCAIAGCDNKPTALASGRVQGQAHQGPLPIALDATSVYWDDATDDFAGGLFKCSIGGCNSTLTALAPGFAYALAVDGSRAYWTTYGQMQIMACSIGGCARPTALTSSASNASPTGIAVDATSIYWAVQLGGVMKCAINGCSNSLTTLVADLRDSTPGVTDPSGNPSPGAIADLEQIAVDDTSVYIVDSHEFGLGRILKCAKNGCNNSPITLASGLNGPVGIAVDADNVYWTETGNTNVSGQTVTGAGRVAKCAIGGCTDSPTVIAANQDGPTGIAVDAMHVYWSSHGVGATDGRISVATK